MDTRLSVFLSWLNTSLMEIVSFAVPWLAPVPVAYMVFRAGVTNFHLPPAISLCMAGLIEGAGIMAIHTANRIEFYRINKRKSDPEPASNRLGWAIFTYIVLVLVVTVLTDVLPGLERWSIVFILPVAYLTYHVNSVKMQQDKIERELHQGQGKKQLTHARIATTTVNQNGHLEDERSVLLRHLSRANATKQEQIAARRRAVLTWIDAGFDVSEMAEMADVSARTIKRDIEKLIQNEQVVQTDDGYTVVGKVP